MSKKKFDADQDVRVAGDQFVEEFCTKPVYDEDGVQVSSAIGKDGKEYPDPVPMAPPVGFDNPPDLMEMMRQMIRSERYQERLQAEGFDTFEEAGDFDVDDDPLPPLTLHEALLFPNPAAGPPASSPPAPSADPQASADRVGGEGAPAPSQGAPAAPSEAPSPPLSSTST